MTYYSNDEKIQLIYTSMINHDKATEGMTKETREIFEFAYKYLSIFEPPIVNKVFIYVLNVWWEKVYTHLKTR